MRKARGFTLIEVMVIVTIIGILAAVAAPSLSESMARRRVEGVANELQADLQYAKTQAVSVNSSVQLITTASGYTVGTTATPALFKTIALETSYTLTSGVTVSFEPYRSFPAAAASITVSNSGTIAQLTVMVDATGAVHMCSPSAALTGYAAC